MCSTRRSCGRAWAISAESGIAVTTETIGQGDLSRFGASLDPVVIDLTGSEPIVHWRSETIKQDETVPPLLNRVLVRTFDVVSASVLLVLTLPIMILLAAIVCVSSSGAVIYSSKRIGRSRPYFGAYKFRTMIKDADRVLRDLLDHDPIIAAEYRLNHKLKEDPRLTVVGKFLRQTSLDELPQLLNVIKGDMSLVGPRPKLPSEADQYGDALQTVLRVRPGLTGLWQTSGRNDLSFGDRITLDVYYATSRTARLDAKIIARTVLQMASPRNHGAY